MATTTSGANPSRLGVVDVVRPDVSMERVSVPDDPAVFAEWFAGLPEDAVITLVSLPGADGGDNRADYDDDDDIPF